MPATKTDVLVVGAGPVGLAMAADLARYGVSVRIVEKAAQRTDKSKALVLWSRSLELMDRLECTGPFLLQGLKVTTLNVMTGSEPIAQLKVDGVASPHPYALMIPQSDTERLLNEHLSKCGVEVERNLQLTSFITSPASVTSTLRHLDGQEETVESRWLVGCDGAHSTVRHQLGMEFVGETMPSNWIVADVHLSGVQRPEEISIAWHSAGILAMFPIRPPRYRVIADVAATSVADSHVAEADAGVTNDSVARQEPTLEEVQAILDGRGPGGITASAAAWLTRFHINERKVAHYRSGRVFLAGDAAHIHSPAGGQGMNTGMQDAFNLAWKIALVSRGICAAEPLLGSYSAERSAVGEMVLAGAGRITTIALMRGGMKQAIRNYLASVVFGLSPVRKRLADALTELSVGYPESPLNGKGSHISAAPGEGERAPIHSNEFPVGTGGSPRFALFAERGHARAVQVTEKHFNLLEPDLRAPFHKGGLWLVRPDGYVALATKQDRWDEVSKYLEGLVVGAN